jgi:hypothetical protein
MIIHAQFMEFSYGNIFASKLMSSNVNILIVSVSFCLFVRTCNFSVFANIYFTLNQ